MNVSYPPSELNYTVTDSFFPSTTLLWNNLPVNIQESSSLSEFKRYLTNNDAKVPSYYYSGQRTEQIIHCRLRLQMGDLNFDLNFNQHLKTKTSHALSATRSKLQNTFCYYVPTITIYEDTHLCRQRIII